MLVVILVNYGTLLFWKIRDTLSDDSRAIYVSFIGTIRGSSKKCIPDPW